MLDLVSETLPYPRAWPPGPPATEPKEGQAAAAGTHTEMGLPAEKKVGKNVQNVLKIFYSTYNTLNCQSSSLCAVDDVLFIL